MNKVEAIKWLSNLKMDIGKTQHQELWHYEQALDEIIQTLKKEPKRGEWLDRASELDAGFGRHNFVCSECAHTAWYFVGGSEDWWAIRKPNYCPNCGADMRGDEV